MNLILAAIVSMLTISAHAEEVWFEGKARWWDDGDTPVLHFRLQGIDAPEKKQLCEDAQGQCYACGKKSTAAMKAMGKGKLRYRFWEAGRYGRPVVSAFTGDVDLQLELIRQGWAIVFRRYVPAELKESYIAAEDEAKAAKRGMWQGKFITPSKWRKGERLACE
jgi:endonuclease YncB( thermonuclease family)